MKKNNDIQKISTSINETYYISTAYRSTVVFCGEVWYYETMVWDYDQDQQLQDIIYSCDSGHSFEHAFDNHLRLVKIFSYLAQRKLRNNTCKLK